MEVVNFILHLDKNLAHIISFLGPLTYIALFLVIFAETGFVVTPFLPGDSLLFIIGTLAGKELLNIWIIYPTLLIASFLGDNINYWAGRHIGPRVFSKENSKIFKKAYLEKTREFYAKHGRKTIILAKFVPVVRTFAPFVAGVGKMHYTTFVPFSFLASFIWITSITFAGYFLGGLPIVKNNFEIAVFAIIGISLLPAIWEYVKAKNESRITKKQLQHATYKDLEKTFEKEHLND